MKFIKKICAVLCAAALLAPSVSAEKEIEVYINGSIVNFDQPPIIYNDRTMVPMRAIFEELGLTVQWFGDEQRITAYDGNNTITMFIGEPYVFVNTTVFAADVSPMIENGRTLVPLRVIGETLNGDVQWYPESRTVTISINNQTTDNSIEAFEYKAFELTNAEREKYGLEPLVWNDSLADIARAHSQDMIDRGFFSHDNPDGKSPFDRMTAAGLRYSAAAENIAAGQATPESVVNDWMNSEGHRANILNPNLKELGVGAARGGTYGIYWTQNFATFR